MARSLSDFVNAALQTVEEVDCGWVESHLGTDWVILDVREPDEFAEGHLPGSLNFPRGFLEVRADLQHPKKDERLANRNQKIVCYCGGGHRSALAAKTLLEMGFADVRSMAGGWTSWANQNLPKEK